jgi:hypothetical protein
MPPVIQQQQQMPPVIQQQQPLPHGQQ